MKRDVNFICVFVVMSGSLLVGWVSGLLLDSQLYVMCAGPLIALYSITQPPRPLRLRASGDGSYVSADHYGIGRVKTLPELKAGRR